MSQITRTGGGGPGPSGGVLTLSGDGGLDVSPNLSGNIDIDGAGGITVTSNRLTNSLTITGSGGAALTFDGDTGAGTTPAANTITFNGAANQITVASPGTGAGHLTVAMTPSIVVANNITATAGDITATAGHLNAPTGIVSTVSATFSGQPNGVLVTDNTGAIDAINGTIDQVLMAFPGNPPAFGDIVGAGGTTVNKTVQGTITISSAAVPAAVTVAGTINQIAVTAGPNYQVSLPNAVTAPGSLTTTGALTSNTTLTTTGINTLNNLAVNGVVQTNAAHQLVASNGANGAVLIGTGVGNAPVWNTVTAGNGIAITNTPGHIAIAEQTTTFAARPTNSSLAVTGDGTPYKIIADYVYLNDGNYNPATGEYTIPANGTYYWGIDLKISNLTALHTGMYFQIYRNGVAWDTPIQNNPSSMFYAAGGVLTIAGHDVTNVFAAGDVISFFVVVEGSTKTITLSSPTRIFGWRLF